MAMTLIQSQTATSDASISFTSGIDSTYKLYIFKFYDCNPETDATNFGFQANVAGQSGYNETSTNAYFGAAHDEADSGADLTYKTGPDQAEGTALNQIHRQAGNGSDESVAGEVFLFNPSNTTYVKHFYCRAISDGGDAYCRNEFLSGYFNVTGAIDEIQFKFSSGDFDGTIKMYGVG